MKITARETGEETRHNLLLIPASQPAWIMRQRYHIFLLRLCVGRTKLYSLNFSSFLSSIFMEVLLYFFKSFIFLIVKNERKQKLKAIMNQGI